MEILANSKHLIIKSRKEINCILFSSIYYLEKFNNKCIIYTESETIEITISLSQINNFLPKYFFRSHRSFIINTQKIIKVAHISKSNIYKVFFDNKDYNYALSRSEKIDNMINILGAL